VRRVREGWGGGRGICGGGGLSLRHGGRARGGRRGSERPLIAD